MILQHFYRKLQVVNLMLLLLLLFLCTTIVTKRCWAVCAVAHRCANTWAYLKADTYMHTHIYIHLLRSECAPLVILNVYACHAAAITTAKNCNFANCTTTWWSGTHAANALKLIALERLQKKCYKKIAKLSVNQSIALCCPAWRPTA